MAEDDAKTLYQRHLDAATRAFWERDWDALMRHLGIPTLMQTLDAELHIKDEGTLRRTQLEQRNSLDRMGATEYHRLCVDARFAPDRTDRIFGQHETFMLRSGTFVMEPYRSEMSLRYEDGMWKAYGLTSRVRNRDYTLICPTLYRDADTTVTRTG